MHLKEGKKAIFQDQDALIHPLNRQIKAWRKASRKMEWGIREEEFK